ncbi:MAG TPA: twin-arginine translocase TatA/TatE family subunit [Thiopseudomonas sp.]|nr:twin-arginine translocase TatA/TatE family subunit [Thiopseudomonas sp.]
MPVWYLKTCKPMLKPQHGVNTTPCCGKRSTIEVSTMGFGGISTWQLVIVAVIILVVFGSKRLRGVGGDVGEAIKGFRKAIKSDDNTTP